MAIYPSVYELIQTYVFGTETLTANEDLVCILIASIASIFVISLPFLVVWKVLNIIMGRW